MGDLHPIGGMKKFMSVKPAGVSRVGPAGRVSGKSWWAHVLLLLFAWVLTNAGPAHASVTLLLEQPYGDFRVAWNPTGHAALYFDHICAATPLQLRPCGPGELGVVISRYENMGNHDWIAVPLVPYLYAVESPDDIPARVTRLDEIRLRDLYRREHLESIAPDTADGGMPPGDWYELVGSAFDRTSYGFRVKTTPDQDAMLIAMFNDQPNVHNYSGIRRNCADFVRITIDRLYPHAIRRNFIADFGVSTPKSAARSLAHYGGKHPEAGMDEFRIPQVPGDLPRSGGVEGVTEAFLKHYGVPLTLISPDATAAVLVAYVGHGRCAVPKNAPVLDVRQMEADAQRQAGAEAAETAAADPAPDAGNESRRDATAAEVPASSFDAFPSLFTAADCSDCIRFEALP
jgi:hypothetical protein